MRRTLWMAVSALILVAPMLSVQAAPADDLEARVSRLEQRLGNSTLLDMLDKVNAMEDEIRQLRGTIEQQNFEIEGLKKRQRELYLDIDRRLSNLERGAMVTPAPSSGASTPPLVTGGPATPALVAPAPVPTPSAPAAPAKTANTPAAQPAPAAPAPTSKEELAAYQSAFDLLRALKYDQAVAAFTDFVKTYPHGRYAHIAQYWVGEAYYAQRDYKSAIDAYEKLRHDYPRSPKVVEALLKIGYSYYELGDVDHATEAMNTLIQQYPGTTEAGQASALLKRLQNHKG